MICAEYIWIDGYQPTANLRSKTKVMDTSVTDILDIPTWGFDGSSTQQADGGDSDCMLIPVSFFKDPIRGGDNILVMCEVMNADGSPHASNFRSKLQVLSDYQYRFFLELSLLYILQFHNMFWVVQVFSL